MSHSFSLALLYFLLNLGFGPALFPPLASRSPPPADQEDTDTIIEEASADALAEAEKGATKEAAKVLAGETGKGAAEEAGKGAAEEEAGKASAEEEGVDDQPSSSAASGSGKYLKVSHNLFVHLPGTASTRAPADG